MWAGCPGCRTRKASPSVSACVLFWSRQVISCCASSGSSRKTMQALIFDFDGVIADSETLANLALVGLITDMGVPTTLDQSIARYTGKRLHEVVATVEADLGRPIPGNFSE